MRVALPRVAEQVVRRQALFLDGLGDGPAEFAWPDLHVVVGASGQHVQCLYSQLGRHRGGVDVGVELPAGVLVVEDLAALVMVRSGRTNSTAAWIFPPSGRCRLGDCCWVMGIGSGVSADWRRRAVRAVSGR